MVCGRVLDLWVCMHPTGRAVAAPSQSFPIPIGRGEGLMGGIGVRFGYTNVGIFSVRGHQ